MIQKMKQKIKDIIYWVVVVVGVTVIGIGLCQANSQDTKKQEVPKPRVISIADGKYELIQLRLANAVKDLQLANEQANQITAGPRRNMDKQIIDALKSFGVPESDAQNWIYDPTNMTFTKPVPQAKAEEKQEPLTDKK